ncbi:MAG TPA: hypothetical protein VG755_09515 [Nannocystaceae bacterium]|nr:hypothetical protein [Nannocystaceae bacterium]
MKARPTLYDRLPETLRRSDVERGQPLRALVDVLERELTELRLDAEQMWDAWFIETCEEWLVPYIGELVGVRGMQTGPDGTVPVRAFTANQFAYRRRKGTVAAFEELGRDLTGRATRALEYFGLCIRTPHIRHVRSQPPATVDLRDTVALERIGSPFESFAHGPDVRHIRSGRGRYNLPNVGLFVWPHEVFAIEGGTAARHAAIAEAFTFDPLGRDVPLFGAPATEQSIDSLAQRRHVPRRLTRLDLWREQELGTPIDLTELAVVPAVPPPAPATDWKIEIADLGGPAAGWPVGRPAPDTIRVDPERGRILFNPSAAPPADAVAVDYRQASPWRIGAGPFDRNDRWLALWKTMRDDVTFFRRVNPQPLPASALGVATFADAITDWNAFVTALPASEAADAIGVIAIDGARTDATATVTIALPAGARLYVVALATSASPGDSLDGDLANGTRPVLRGDLTVVATAPASPGRLGGKLVLDGIVLAGHLAIAPGELERLELIDCTLPPPFADLVVGAGAGGQNAGLELDVRSSQIGPIAAPTSAGRWTIADSIVHGAPAAIDAIGVELDIGGSTIIGTTRGRILRGSNSLFTGAIDVAQHQQGCLRYSYAPLDANTPRRFRCQPDTALQGIVDPIARERITATVRPELESLDPADPGYAWLAEGSARELRIGSEHHAEIGAAEHLRWAIREANLRAALRQYFRFGLEAGLFFETETARPTT